MLFLGTSPVGSSAGMLGIIPSDTKAYGEKHIHVENQRRNSEPSGCLYQTARRPAHLSVKSGSIIRMDGLHVALCTLEWAMASEALPPWQQDDTQDRGTGPCVR